MSATELNIRRLRGDQAVVELKGEHEAYTAVKLGRELDDLIDEGRGILIDLRQTSFIDSQTAGVLLDAHRRSRETGIPFRTILGEDTGWPVRSLLEVTGLGATLDASAA